MTRAEVGTNVELFDEAELSRVRAPPRHLAIDGAIRPLRDKAVDDRRQKDIEEHVHADASRSYGQRLKGMTVRVKTAQKAGGLGVKIA
jgi:hypothetical protein